MSECQTHIKSKQVPWNKGKTGVYSQETLAKKSASAKGKRPSSETLAKLKWTPERYAKVSATNSTNKNKNAQNRITGFTFIYGLIDPLTKELRYVGKGDSPERRLVEHINDKSHTHKTCWIKKLAALNHQPELILLEEIPKTHWVEAEQFWIMYARSLGCNLVNLTIGGDGITTFQHTEETKAKISKAGKGRKASPETIERMKLAQSKIKKKPHTAEAKSKISAATKGRPVSQSTREKLSTSNKAAWTAEKKAQHSLLLKGRKRNVR